MLIVIFFLFLVSWVKPKNMANIAIVKSQIIAMAETRKFDNYLPNI
ncbi:MAG: hypothetical protein F6K60_20055 [Okeania sp. SIO1F9]|nr:hypothetical protein [Okeania hirsuta]NET78178.1 hypothetical protein [Okeania sp. SIO1F9]